MVGQASPPQGAPGQRPEGQGCVRERVTLGGRGPEEQSSLRGEQNLNHTGLKMLTHCEYTAQSSLYPDLLFLFKTDVGMGGT